MMHKPPLIIIVGPTASGKSDLAIRIAKKINGEIISADSRQIYRDMDIGTAKVKGVWKHGTFVSKKIPHFCIDMISPKHIYTAAKFVLCAKQAISNMLARNSIPIIVGGSAFWIDAFVYDLNFPEVAPNPRLRKHLEKKPAEKLLEILKKFDPKRAKKIEQKNPRRLIRAIEIAHAQGRTPILKKRYLYRTLWIGMCPDEELLQRNITVRARNMISNGLVAETEKLLANGITQKRIHEFGFEYTAALNVIQRKINRNKFEQILIRDTIRYTRRQMRWFKRNHEINWVKTPKQAQLLTTQFLHSFYH